MADDERFIADNVSEDGTPLVLDTAVYGPNSRARVVVACRNDVQAKLIAGVLNRELGWGTSAPAPSRTQATTTTEDS